MCVAIAWSEAFVVFLVLRSVPCDHFFRVTTDTKNYNEHKANSLIVFRVYRRNQWQKNRISKFLTLDL
jgi:hypothetical protein